jgi:hypothetical protein
MCQPNLLPVFRREQKNARSAPLKSNEAFNMSMPGSPVLVCLFCPPTPSISFIFLALSVTSVVVRGLVGHATGRPVGPMKEKESIGMRTRKLCSIAKCHSVAQ